VIGAEDSRADEVARLDSQAHSLEERLAHLEAEQRKLRQELERLYAELMTEFEKRWPPLKRMPNE
jgi:chaperonin cofactor prefoldin